MKSLYRPRAEPSYIHRLLSLSFSHARRFTRSNMFDKEGKPSVNYDFSTVPHVFLSEDASLTRFQCDSNKQSSRRVPTRTFRLKVDRTPTRLTSFIINEERSSGLFWNFHFRWKTRREYGSSHSHPILRVLLFTHSYTLVFQSHWLG